MKPWGCQAVCYIFLPSFLPATEKLASRGSRGRPGAPLVAARTRRTLWHGRPTGPFVSPDALGCTRLFGLRHLPGRGVCRPTHPDTPRRPFVRTSFGDSHLSLPDR